MAKAIVGLKLLLL